jgi:fused signal recognition particle receptor
MLFKRARGKGEPDSSAETLLDPGDSALSEGVVDAVLPEEIRREESLPETSQTEEIGTADAGRAADGPVSVPEATTSSRNRRFGRTRGFFSSPLGSLRSGSKIDARTLDELEESLILADVGMDTTKRLLDGAREKLRSKELDGDADALIAYLKWAVLDMFGEEDRSLHYADAGMTVWLFVGVNGVGKTTTIGKLAHRETNSGKQVVLAAGDTFRAAAGEQLSLWAERSHADIVQGADGADPSSVVFDAIAHASARGADLVLADSAGRLHNKTNLMEELKKVRRIADRDPGNVTEVLLVLDATTGQNGLAQAREFAQAVGVTGVVLTKLDGTAKGGIVLAIRGELGLPIKLVGLGEGVGDLVEFDPADFADALFASD